ncbi:hypothetical protein FB451DRAFT_1171420 [Mycena latifolia]|nr:hypothetical protein FB451DRAFT_1171420 [Mycena latifolia]
MWGSMPSIAGLSYLLILGAAAADAEPLSTLLSSRAVEFCSNHPQDCPIDISTLPSPPTSTFISTTSDSLSRDSAVRSIASTLEISSATIDTVSSTSGPAIPPGGSLTVGNKFSTPIAPNSDSSSHVSTVASGVSTPRIATSATDTAISTSTQAVPPAGSSPANTTTTSSRQRARTAAIAGSVVAVCIVVGVLLLILWRRRRVAQLMLPRQFPRDEIRTAMRPTRGADAEKNTDREPLGGTSHQADFMRAGPENEVPSNAELEDGNNRNREEALTERMRRVEAQLESLLTLGVPEGAPPSYAG